MRSDGGGFEDVIGTLTWKGWLFRKSLGTRVSKGRARSDNRHLKIGPLSGRMMV